MKASGRKVGQAKQMIPTQNSGVEKLEKRLCEWLNESTAQKTPKEKKAQLSKKKKMAGETHVAKIPKIPVRGVGERLK